MSTATGFVSVFDQVFDAVVFGAGYAGFAACRRLTDAGLSVLLVDRFGDVCSESGRAMSERAGVSDNPLWVEWVRELSKRGVVAGQSGDAAGTLIDAAPAEVLANQAVVRMPGLRVLYYASPVSVELRDGMVVSVVLATKSGLKRVVGKRYLDATETGDMIGLVPGAAAAREAKRLLISLYFQHHAWADDKSADKTREISCDTLAGAKLTWTTARWANVRKLVIDLPGSEKHARGAWLPALTATREALGALLDDAVLTHGSVIPLASYDEEVTADTRGLPANVACGSPARSDGGFATLSERYALGVKAAERMTTLPEADITRAVFEEPLSEPEPVSRIDAKVVVAGLGTGGLLAAIAAGRETPGVVAFDPMPYAGGIGTGGGIHVYYHGVKGGLQEELDERTRKIMPLFGKVSQVRGFHPDAKKIVADNMLREAGVTVVSGFLTQAKTKNGWVNEGLVSTTAGMVSITGQAWIDATGDGDLSAMAGAGFILGRQADGQLHAYSQSSGRVHVIKGLSFMSCLNYDAGFVDPTDVEDLTRARLAGIGHYDHGLFTEDDHPTYIAPAIGLRQARQIECDYMMTLADLIERRRFDDCVGYTGCHYDNHAIDYEMESDEPMFWVWVCRQWRARTACEIPYRSLLPQGLENVWVACRALGVTIDAHHSMRMQRDIQRIGEVAGIAAALAAGNSAGSQNAGSRDIDMRQLTQKLGQSGAVKLVELNSDQFGHSAPVSLFTEPVNLTDELAIAQWAKALGNGDQQFSEPWWLYRAGQQAAGKFVEPLLESESNDASWYAASIMAMWGDARAQARLCRAIETREFGFQGVPDQEKPESSARVVPRWMAAVALLRVCGNADCLATLRSLSADSELILNVRTSIAKTFQRLAERCELGLSERETVLAATDDLLAVSPPLQAGSPQRVFVKTKLDPAPTHRYWVPRVIEDFSWQMHVEIAKARMAFGGEPHEVLWMMLNDERVIVRRAARRALGQAELVGSAV